MSFRDKLQQKIQEKNAEFPETENVRTGELKDNIEPFESSPFFGIDNVRNYPSCLDLRLADGNSKASPYSYILEINFNPSEGIEIITTTKKIFITGRNLKLLYNYLTAFRVKHIQANVGNDLTNERDLFVKEIKIEEI